MKSVKLLLVAAMALAVTARAEQTFELDKTHTTIGFAISHLVIREVEGRFNDFEGAIQLADDNTVTGAKATIQAKSIDTGVAKRDEHLRSPDFFNAEQHPTITFASKKVEKNGDKLVMVGEFTMHGVTKEIRIPFTVSGPIKDPWGMTRIGFKGETTINRKDYGLTYNKVLETGGLAVGEEVKISLKGEAVKK